MDRLSYIFIVVRTLLLLFLFPPPCTFLPLAWYGSLSVTGISQIRDEPISLSSLTEPLQHESEIVEEDECITSKKRLAAKGLSLSDG